MLVAGCSGAEKLVRKVNEGLVHWMMEGKGLEPGRGLQVTLRHQFLNQRQIADS